MSRWPGFAIFECNLSPMKTRRILALSIASLLLTPFAARAVTDTWDGGSPINSFLNSNANWLDNSAPLSDLLNTDLIFAGMVRLSPNVSAAFSTNSITFDNTAGAFAITGQPLSVGTGGILNNSTQIMTFNNPLDFSGVASSTINASAGRLTFANTVTLPTGTLTVTGGSATSFGNISGTGQLSKTGTGTMTWTPNITTAFNVTINAGTLTMGADGTTDRFSSTLDHHGQWQHLQHQ